MTTRPNILNLHLPQVSVNGPSTHPLFAFLKARLKKSYGSFVRSNFTVSSSDEDACSLILRS